MKRVIWLMLMLLLTGCLTGCFSGSEKKEGTVYSNARFLVANTADSADEVFYSENGTIMVFKKKSGKRLSTGLEGEWLTVYGDHLYYIGEDCALRRIPVEKAKKPDSVLGELSEVIFPFDNWTQYEIDNGRIYYDCSYQPVKSTDLNGENPKMWDGEAYVGTVDGQIYTVDSSIDGNGGTTTLLLKREGETVCSIPLHIPAGYCFNDCCCLYSENACYFIREGVLYRCQFSAESSSETAVLTLAESVSDFSDERSNLLAITEEGVFYFIGEEIFFFDHGSDSSQSVLCPSLYKKSTYCYISTVDGRLYLLDEHGVSLVNDVFETK